MFFVIGIFIVFVGIIVFFYFDNGLKDVKWFSESECFILFSVFEVDDFVK